MTDLSKIKEALREILGTFESQKLLNKIGLAQLRNIKSRTRKGLDLFGRPFKAYTDEWKERKSIVYRMPNHPVNLTLDDVSGMLSPVELDHIVSNDLKSVELYFRTPAKRKLAGYHDQEGVGKSKVIRRFWGVSEEDEKSLTDIIVKDLELKLQELTEK